VPASRFRSLGTRAVWAQIGLALVVIADLFYMWSIFSEIVLLDRLNSASLAEILITLSDAEASDARVVAAGVLVLGSGLVAAVTFLIWINGAYSNLNTLGTTAPRFSTGWAVGCWFARS
jgi:hypothetical protein